MATYHASSSGSLLLKAALPALRPLLEKIRGGIAVSEMARRWQVEQLGGDSVLIPNGVDTARFRKAQAPHAEDDERPLEIVFLGRLDEPRKGLDILLAALAQVQRPFHCTVIGGGTPLGMFPNATTFTPNVVASVTRRKPRFWDEQTSMSPPTQEARALASV